MGMWVCRGSSCLGHRPDWAVRGPLLPALHSRSVPLEPSSSPAPPPPHPKIWHPAPSHRWASVGAACTPVTSLTAAVPQDLVPTVCRTFAEGSQCAGCWLPRWGHDPRVRGGWGVSCLPSVGPFLFPIGRWGFPRPCACGAWGGGRWVWHTVGAHRAWKPFQKPRTLRL